MRLAGQKRLKMLVDNGVSRLELRFIDPYQFHSA